jgi:hypothetical protein
MTTAARRAATALAAVGLVASLAGCQQTVQTSTAAPRVNWLVARDEPVLPVANGMAADQETEAAQAVEAARIAAEQEAARVAAEREAARAAESGAQTSAASGQAAQRSPADGRTATRPAPVTGGTWEPPPATPKTLAHLVDKSCWAERDYFMKSYTVVMPDGSSWRQNLMAGAPELTIVSIYKGGQLIPWGGLRWFYVYPEDQSFLPCDDEPTVPSASEN